MTKTVRVAIGAALFLAAIQLVPYERDRSNPPVAAEPQWNSPQTRALAKRACFDCHSNETVWPWYSDVAPVSWLLERDVKGGRRHLNFSEWSRPQRHAAESPQQIEKGAMPPWFFLPMHPEARLSQAEKDQLMRGLSTTFASDSNAHD